MAVLKVRWMVAVKVALAEEKKRERQEKSVRERWRRG